MQPHYSPEVWHRFRAPRHAGVLVGAGVYRGEARTPASRAVLRLYLEVAAGHIRRARFQAFGCPSTIAAGDWLCERLEQRSLAEVSGLAAAELAEALALAPERRHCAVLAEDALRAGLQAWQSQAKIKVS
ncbi:MAG TPA: iron-sulfur cluster assembly scaffold protein [Nevskiales bacterium]|nr:iron-sulfur cluster assembly scaffold protein [Nevskiales bacterium]